MTSTLSSIDDPLFAASLCFAPYYIHATPLEGMNGNDGNALDTNKAICSLADLKADIQNFHTVQYHEDNSYSFWICFISSNHFYQYASKPISHLTAYSKAVETQMDLEKDVRQAPSDGKDKHL